MPADQPEQRQPVLCPYCGQTQWAIDRCQACGGWFEPLSQAATQIAMGPWFIRDTAKPFRPGCSFQTLKRMIKSGRIKPTTVLRGPTTRQFWSIARNVPGVAHRLGYCHHCGVRVEKTHTKCPHCSQRFMDPPQRNELGLQYPTRAAAQTASRALDRPQVGPEAGPVPLSASGQLSSSAAGDDGGLHLLAAALAESDKEPASTGPADAAALDFGPSEQPPAEGAMATTAPLGPLSTWSWVLVGLNIAAAVLVVLLLWFNWSMG